MCSERPNRPIATNSSAKSGFCESSSENSSTTMNSAGSGSRRTPDARARSYSATLAKFPAARSTSCRRVISPDRASFIRSTIASSCSRLVMIAATCGADSRPRKVAPPLKSTRTRLSSAGECVANMDTTRVRKNSDFPEPVAPMHSPCGPVPPCALSLMSSSTGVPLGWKPIGTRNRSLPTRPRHSTAGSKRATSSMPSSAGRPGSPAVASESRLAMLAAVARW